MTSRVSPRLRVTLLAAGAVPLAALAYAVTASGDPAPRQADGTNVAPLAQQFSAVMRAAGPEDALPPAAARLVAEDGSIDVAAARRTFSSASHSIYLVPGPYQLCVVDVSPTGIGKSCAFLETAVNAATPPITFQVIEGGTRVSGVFPDGVRDVSLDADGTRTPVAVRDNTFSVEVPDGSSAILEWTGPDGVLHKSDAAMPTQQPAEPAA